MMTNDTHDTHDVLPEILPCAKCEGAVQHLEAIRPEGRQADVWRVVCACGNASAQWSVSKPSAIRLWNRHMTEEK